MRKIKKIALSGVMTRSRIHNKHSLSDDLIRFSFKFLNICDKFHLNVEIKYLHTLVERLKNISGMTLNEFKETGPNKSLRIHPLRWHETTEPKGFVHLPEQLRQCEPWQFQLTANAHGRIHGLLIDEIFYIVWFDPEHKLYS